MAINLEFIREVGIARWLRRTAIRQFSKRILRRDNRVTLPTGLRMQLPRTSRFSTEVFVTRCNVDWGSEALFAGLLDPTGAFLDIGANVGYYSLYMLPKVAEVHAFEPDTRPAVALRQNLAAHPNAYMHAMALGNRTGRAGFAQEKSSETSHLTEGAGLHEVELTTVDHFVRERRLSVSGIKIDVEGFDLDVLYGAKHTLQSQHPLVLTEAKPEETLFNFVELLQYEVFAFVRTSGKFQFRELGRNHQEMTKMLFLAPPQLLHKFNEIAEAYRAI